MKKLFIVTDVPKYEEDCSSFHYVVKADTHNEAIEIVMDQTGHTDWEWDASLADNEEIME